MKKLYLAACASAMLWACSSEASAPAQSADSADAAQESSPMTTSQDIDAPMTANAQAASAYSFTLPNIEGGELAFSAFQGKPMLVVNTASMCGFTPQYEGLQALYDDYKDQGFVVIGIPSQDFGGQEYDNAEETKDFCEVTFGINFPMTVKQHVKGEEATAFYKWAKGQLGDDAEPKWNFHKILVGPDGQAVKAYGSRTAPQDAGLVSDIEALL